MTNEELVVRIRAGEQHLMGELWEQVEGLIKWKARRIMTILDSTGINSGVEFDDLYQSGYLALVAAVKPIPVEKVLFLPGLCITSKPLLLKLQVIAQKSKRLLRFGIA